ncbi:MAG TPA: hypothetical protein VLG28_17460 [Acidimicrobiia bacterium]|nr:hypothetical protein [Acidimicrobiia bacterium]
MIAREPTSEDRGAAVGIWLLSLATVAAGIAGLHGLGSNPAFAADVPRLWAWIGAHSPERVVLALGRYAALGLGYWVLGSLLLATLARALQLPTLIRSMDRITLPVVRCIADRVVAVSLAVSSVTAGGAGVAFAADQPTQESEAAPVVRLHQPEAVPHEGYVPVPAADAPLNPVRLGEEAEDEYTPVPAGEAANDPNPHREAADWFVHPPSADLATSAARLDPATAYDHDVVRGDNLWTIAERHLAAALQRETTEAETATYWAHLIETNRGQLRSGNPDLIYPGEVVVCPATADVGLTD